MNKKTPQNLRGSYINAGSPGDKMEEHLNLPVKDMKSGSIEVRAAGMSSEFVASIASRKANSTRGGNGTLSSL